MPDWKEEIRRRLSVLKLDPMRESEIIEEVSQHLESLYEELLADRATEEEASRLLLEDLNENEFLTRELRRIEPQITREPIVAGTGSRNMIADFWHDLRYAVRMFSRNPMFTLAAVISLALGIGGNAAMFSLVNSVLIQPLPYSHPERLMRVTEWYPKGAVVALQERSRTMDIAAFTLDSQFNLTGQGEAAHLVGSSVSANFFSVLGARAEIGRTFKRGEDQPGQDRLVILSHALWQSKFGGDPEVLGRPIMIYGEGREVVGVMPPDFDFPSSNVQLWIPFRLDSTNIVEHWNSGWVPLIGRLRPGATIEQAQGEMGSLISQIIPLFPWPMPANWNAGATVVPLQESLVGDIRGKLLILMCAVGLVLLIACANVASLLLARMTARQREITIRAALGAARGRIVRQLLTESLLLALAGAGIGIVLGFEGLSVLKSILPLNNPRFAQASIDWQVISFVVALTIVTGLGFGFAPALSASKLNLAESLKSRGQQSTGISGIRLRSWLITAEVALAVILVIGAGLLIKSLWALTQVNPGFRPEQILTVRIFPDGSVCQERAGCVAFYDRLVEQSRAIAGVSEVAAANTLPLSAEIPSLPVELEGHPFIPSENNATMFWAGAVTPDYLEIMQIPLLAGRRFTYADGEKSPGVVLVSESTARHFWPDENPIGKQIRVVWDEKWRTVVGVVADVRQYNLTGTTPDWINGEFYLPYPQAVGLDRQLPATMSLILRTTADPQRVASDIRRFVSNLNPNIPVSEVQNLEGVVSGSRAESSSLMWLFICFGGSALLLAAVGTYGVVSYATAQRTYEMGVRIALGATRNSIFRLVLNQSLRLVLAGVAIGIVGSLALTQMMSSLLYGVTATDPMTFLAVGALLIAVALLAGYFPARRAMKVDPMIALRHE